MLEIHDRSISYTDICVVRIEFVSLVLFQLVHAMCEFPIGVLYSPKKLGRGAVLLELLLRLLLWRGWRGDCGDYFWRNEVQRNVGCGGEGCMRSEVKCGWWSVRHCLCLVILCGALSLEFGGVDYSLGVGDGEKLAY